MIIVKIDKSMENVILECDESSAFGVINITHKYNPTICNFDGLATIEVPISNIDSLNKDLIAFKDQIRLDNSFKEWKEKNKGIAPVIIRAGVVNCKIYRGQHSLPHSKIEDVCKYFFMPAVRQQRFKEGKWDGYIHLYEKRFHKFPTGLLDKVCGVLDESKIPYRVEYCYEQNPPKQFNWKAKDLFKPEDDQWEALEACVKGKRGVCKAPTGFGKLIAM